MKLETSIIPLNCALIILEESLLLSGSSGSYAAISIDSPSRDDDMDSEGRPISLLQQLPGVNMFKIYLTQ